MTRHMFLALFLAACSSSSPPTGEAPLPPAQPDATASRVEVAVIEPSAAKVDLQLPGEIEGGEDTLLAAALGGFVERVRVKVGDQVRRGQSIAEVDKTVYQAGVAQAEAQLRLAESDLERAKTLGDLTAQAQLDALVAQRDIAAAQLRSAKAQLARAVITAPHDGVIGQVEVSKGEVAGPGTVVARLVSLDPVTVTVSVPDRDVTTLIEGAPAVVTTAASGTSLEGVIAAVAPVGDLRTRTWLAEVDVPNPNRVLLPGMIAKVSIQRSVADDAVIIPQDWLVTRRTEYGVYVERENVAEWRPVELGTVVGDQVVVKAGLDAGDRVIITGHRELIDGDAVQIAREGRCCDRGRVLF